MSWTTSFPVEEKELPPLALCDMTLAPCGRTTRSQFSTLRANRPILQGQWLTTLADDGRSVNHIANFTYAFYIQSIIIYLSNKIRLMAFKAE